MGFSNYRVISTKTSIHQNSTKIHRSHSKGFNSTSFPLNSFIETIKKDNPSKAIHTLQQSQAQKKKTITSTEQTSDQLKGLPHMFHPKELQ
jgi:hypothetical protein